MHRGFNCTIYPRALSPTLKLERPICPAAVFTFVLTNYALNTYMWGDSNRYRNVCTTFTQAFFPILPVHYFLFCTCEKLHTTSTMMTIPVHVPDQFTIMPLIFFLNTQYIFGKHGRGTITNK